ncbi:phospholipase effector Tle1 domain-containing protein, partial [Sagittula sp.]|uniref:phospholipase effector Tle1 domain-containing protein n=1 Tax=Sagittula sp. TaxID=2038081 RepID=UPI00351809D1
MQWTRWAKRLYHLLRPGLRHEQSRYEGTRGQVTHVIILDGTMSTLAAGHESNAGLAYRLLSEVAHARLSLYYEAGVQWQDWASTGDVVTGRGINRQIRRADGYLASRSRAGDRVSLMGSS